MTNRGEYWTEEDEAKLIHMWNEEDKTAGYIGETLNRNYKMVLAKMARLKANGVYLKIKLKRVKTNLEEAERKCLRCQGFFLSESRFNRLCTDCKKKNAQVYSEIITSVLR